MSVTLSPSIRIFTLVGVLAATGLAAFLFLLARGETGSEPSVSSEPVTTAERGVTQSPRTTPRSSSARPTAVRAKSGFPPPVDRALRRRRVVVVAVYIPGAAVDAIVRAEARAAASRTGAGYVAISASSERLVSPLVAKTGVLPDPAVLIVKRPGVVTTTLSVTDRDTIAQAVAQARR